MTVKLNVTVVTALGEGKFKTNNCAEFHYEPYNSTNAHVRITGSEGSGEGAYFSATAAREAADFFNALATQLEAQRG